MDIRHCIVRVGTGSGILVLGKDDISYILTCAHVLGENHEAVEVAFCDEEAAFSQKTTTSVIDFCPIKEEDIALLACPPIVPLHYQSIKLLNSLHGRGLPTFTFGFPISFGTNGRADRCKIENLETKTNGGFDLLTLSEGQALKGGFSGGPLLDAQYRHCLGILRDLEKPDEYTSEALAYAYAAERIVERFEKYLTLQTLHPYQAELRAMYQEVVLNDSKGMTLADVYIEPHYGIHQNGFPKDDERIKNLDNPFFQVDKSLHHDLITFFKGGKSLLSLEVKQSTVILLLGAPGQGKTSFCKRVIYDLTSEKTNPFGQIYWLRLRDIPNPIDLAIYPEKIILEELKTKVTDLEINWKNSLLIFDGLDELYIQEGFGSSKIDEICKSLENMAERKIGLQILITSRYGYVDLEALKQRNILILRLEDLSETQQEHWLTKYRFFHEESPLKIANLRKYREHRSIQELLGQPILLHMIATLKEDASNKPNRAAIYGSLVSQLVERPWSAKGQINLLKDIDLDEKTLRHALQDIAHAIFISGKGYLRKEELEKLPKVETILNKIQQQNLSNDLLWRIVMSASYMTDKNRTAADLENSEDQSAYGIEFLHKSMYEYLCAEKIWRDILNGFLGKGDDGQWKIRDGNSALNLAHDLFSSAPLSQEVHGYLVEIIQNHHPEIDKSTLSSRMQDQFAYCLERHFLYQFHSSSQKFPIQMAISTFKGYWSILSNLGQKVNYIDSISISSQFISLVQTSFFNTIYKDNLNLSFQKLTGCELTGSNFNNSNMYHVDLSEALIDRSFFFSANLERANLKKANLFLSVLIHANLNYSDLSKATLNETNMMSSNIVNADMRGTNLSGANLFDSYLTHSDLSKAILLKTILSDADLSYANLSNALLTKADLTNANLTGAKLNNAYLIGTKLRSAIFTLEQLLSTKSLYQATGIPDEMKNELEALKPSLFDLPQIDDNEFT